MATFFIEQFGCRATQADAAAIERQLRDRGYLRVSGREFRRRRRGEYLHGDGVRGLAGASGDSRHSPEKSGGAHCGHRMLRPARAGRTCGPPGRRLGRRKFAQAGNSAADRGNEPRFAPLRSRILSSGVTRRRNAAHRYRPGKNSDRKHPGANANCSSRPWRAEKRATRGQC